MKERNTHTHSGKKSSLSWTQVLFPLSVFPDSRVEISTAFPCHLEVIYSIMVALGSLKVPMQTSRCLKGRLGASVSLVTLGFLKQLCHGNQRTNWTLLIGNTTVQLGGSWTRPARASEAWAPNHHTALLPLAWMTAKPVKCFPECFPNGWHLLSTCVTVYRIQFKCSIV